MSGAKYRFFCEDIESGALNAEESAHALRVLRLQVNDPLEITDGKGHLWQAKIAHTFSKILHFEITDQFTELREGPELVIALAPTKSIDRFEFFLEKTTEIGVEKIVPVLVRNSERKEIKLEKLRKNLISAVKQSGNLFVPHLDAMTPFNQVIEPSAYPDHQKFIAHCASDETKIELFDALKDSKKIVILIGPEGDFSPEEVTLAKQNGFIPVSLGKSRLRTETAGITACLTTHIKFSHFR